MIQVEQSQLAEEQTLVMLDLVEGILRVAVAVKLFVVGAIAALAVAARDELSWPMVGTVIALGAAAYALRGETLGDNEHV